MKKTTLTLVLILTTAALSACGGGGSDGSGQEVVPKAVYPIPLRPCETTGPTAPTCAASQSAGTH
ncbi:hypothetical protein AB1286_33130 [Trinickia sp. NRRL B-1857]|uniref:hypothetical protein n=1 Tax=Trinickia sp. NRRL B-1857 TaxID=3162879 RepID=UPI003D2B640E